MKELSIEQKAKRYDEVSKEVNDFFEGRQKMYSDVTQTLKYLFPELKESEDERIRKALIRFHKSTIDIDGIKGDEIVAWLEKQGDLKDIVDRHKDSWYNEGKIAGMAEGLTDDEKYQQGWHDALEKQGEQKPSQWNISDYRTWQYIVSDVLTKHQGIGQYLDDGFCKKIAKYMQENWSKKLSLEQNPAWSEEDEEFLSEIISDIKFAQDKHPDSQMNQIIFEEEVTWLKSLKQRIGG